MDILHLTGTFGRLDHSELSLSPGLNVLYAPNETGKSTWGAFIRTMLYGLSTRERGPLADKNRYAPWTGAPMQGRMDLTTHGDACTLLRETRRAASPLGEFSCTYTGTGTPVPGITGQNAGEVLLGVPREVFERSAFIGQNALAVDQDAELERRIAALITTGEEDTSYTESYDRLKKQLNERVTRGKVELSLTVQNVDAADTVVTVNMELARSYQQAMRDLSEQLGVKNDISAAVLTRFPDVLTTRHADVDEEQLWQDVSAVTAQALDRFVEMRAAEGAKMKADVESRLVFLEQCVGKVESLSAGRVENYTNRLYEKLKVILQDRDIDDARVLTEAAIFGDKTAVDEETVRLRSHIAQYRDILQLDEPVGRKLDFLTQELNRETNTIGSKCQDLDITRIVVDMKAEIEKIREQIQNLE